jgi:hypothetical protein
MRYPKRRQKRLLNSRPPAFMLILVKSQVLPEFARRGDAKT